MDLWKFSLEGKPIAHTANGLNLAFQSKGFQGSAQMADMIIDGAFFYVDCFIPERVLPADAVV